MDALDIKLLRDFRRLWAQGLAIALVLGCGVAIFVMSFGMYRALNDTRTAYYERNRFADVFAAVTRAPTSLVPAIEAIPGVLAVETRVAGSALLDRPGLTKPALGQFLSLPVSGAPRLNVPLLRQGRWPDPRASSEVLVNEPFARANGYRPGDSLRANLNGTMRELTMVGTALSPEYIYTIGPGAMMPDNEGYGIFWMPEPALAAAFDRQGAFNDVALRLSRGANEDEVIARLDALTARYGGTGAHGRAQQQSNAFIDGELKQLHSMAFVLPPVFFAVAVFLVNMVIGRIVALERSEIGLMKALGYTTTRITLHYLSLALLIAVLGLAAGFGAGAWLARGMARIYAKFFDFPYLIFSVSADVYLLAATLGLATAAMGAWRAAHKAAALPPAVAMSPPAPPIYRRSVLDRVLRTLRFGQTSVMIIRNILRWPFRALTTALGLAMAVAILTGSGFFEDAIKEIVDVTFNQANRQDATLILSRDAEASALQEAARLPGVLQAEAGQMHAVVLRNGHLSKRVAIEGRPPETDLTQVIDAQGRVASPPGEGILLSVRLAGQLDLRPGDPVTVEFLTGRRETHEVAVAGTLTQYMGLGAYMEAATLDRMLRRAPQVNLVNLTLDPAQRVAFDTAVKGLPGVIGTAMLADAMHSFQETLETNIDISTVIYAVIGVLITVGVTYNSARIQLSERARDLASLRILGFTRGEVSYILIGETALLALAAQPLGWLLGAGLSAAMVAGFESDLYSVPFVLSRATFAWSSAVVLAAAAVSALVVRRRLDNLDLIEVMKTRE